MQDTGPLLKCQGHTLVKGFKMFCQRILTLWWIFKYLYTNVHHHETVSRTKHWSIVQRWSLVVKGSKCHGHWSCEKSGRALWSSPRLASCLKWDFQNVCRIMLTFPTRWCLHGKIVCWSSTWSVYKHAKKPTNWTGTVHFKRNVKENSKLLK